MDSTRPLLFEPSGYSVLVTLPVFPSSNTSRHGYVSKESYVSPDQGPGDSYGFRYV